MKNQKSEIYTKELYDKLPEEKKDKVLKGIISEFAASGINGCNVRTIAKKIGISHGSLFHYFSSKDDMIHTIIQEGVKMQQRVLKKGLSLEGDFFQKIELIFRDSLNFAKENKDIISIWLELSQPYHEKFTQHTLQMEKEAIVFLKNLVNDGKKDGSIKNKLSADVIAYIIDSILANLMKSSISGIERMKFEDHFSVDYEESNEVIKKIISNLKNSFA